MNREIKFRAWRLEEMWYPEDLQKDFYMDFDGRIVRKWDGQGLTNQFTLMQYTGLKDKNGVEIYEGDITKEQIGLRSDEISVVMFKNGYFNAHGRNIYDKMEVIGNIYQNPELLTPNK
jgi:uncharacterized phage protein (TIGR01671 family)